jgi:hypothetical protein
MWMRHPLWLEWICGLQNSAEDKNLIQITPMDGLI